MMDKVYRFLNSRFFVVFALIVVSPYWIAFVAQQTVVKSLPWLAMGAASEVASGLSGAELDQIDISRDEREEILKNIQLHFVKLNPSEWGGNQEALFKLSNKSSFTISDLTVTAEFFDDDGKLLDTDSTTILSSEQFIPGSDQYFKFSYRYERRIDGESVNIGLASLAVAKIIDFRAVAKRP